MRVEDLSEAYRIVDWMDNPYEKSGRKRYLKALQEFKQLVEHIWLKSLPPKVRVIDVCAGRGIGGVALARVLKETGHEVDLTLVDLRPDALRDAEKFCADENVKCKCVVKDAVKVHELGVFDVALLYGGPLAHFDAWSLLKMFASVSQSLNSNGVVIVEEMDRIYHIFRGGFKDFIVETVSPEKLTVSAHSGYDAFRDVYRRVMYEMKTGRAVEVELTFRSVATIASLLWIFFHDVDLIGKDERLYFIVGYKPRRRIRVEDLREPPLLLRKK